MVQEIIQIANEGLEMIFGLLNTLLQIYLPLAMFALTIAVLYFLFQYVSSKRSGIS